MSQVQTQNNKGYKLSFLGLSSLVILAKLIFVGKKIDEEKPLTPEQILQLEWQQAIKEYQIAQNHFDNAIGTDHIDIATDQLTIARKKMDIIVRKMRKEKQTMVN